MLGLRLFMAAGLGLLALASALERKAALVTGDPEFRKVEHLVDVVWVE